LAAVVRRPPKRLLDDLKSGKQRLHRWGDGWHLHP
jgi:hypothetical protein